MTDPKFVSTPVVQPLPEQGKPLAGKGGALAVLIGTSAAAILTATVAMWEGKRNDPYKDIVGIPTVCYGETKVQMRRYTDDECKAMLADSLVGYARPVLKRNPELTGHPYQLAAAASLTYNIGPVAYKNSSIARHFSAGRWRQACDGFMAWNKARVNGKLQPVKGLTRRRAHERQLCLTGL